MATIEVRSHIMFDRVCRYLEKKGVPIIGGHLITLTVRADISEEFYGEMIRSFRAEDALQKTKMPKSE